MRADRRLARRFDLATPNYLSLCTDEIVCLNRDREMVKMSFYPWLNLDNVVRHNYVDVQFGFTCGQEERLVALFSKLDVPLSRVRAAVHGVVEPLKVRVITKGECVPYMLCKPVQKLFHDILREMPCFRLIGRPCNVLDVQDVWNRAMSGEDPVLHSIDYKAATDCLKREISEWIMSTLVYYFDAKTRDLCARVLGMHELHYDAGGPAHGVAVQQVGQLMGSILSFIVLCLANLGVMLVSLKRAGDVRSRQKKMKSLLINGDDGLFRAPRFVGDILDQVSSAAGLRPSIGKSYHHPVCANINSTDYFFRNGSAICVPYLNTGLLFGQSKVLDTLNCDMRSEGGCRSLCSTANELLRGCYYYKKEKSLWLDFFELNREELVKEAGLRNFFVSETLGGMGIKLPYKFRWKLSFGQRILALRKLEQLGVGCSGSVAWRPKGRGVEFPGIPVGRPTRRHFMTGDLHSAFQVDDWNDGDEPLVAPEDKDRTKYFKLRRTEQDASEYKYSCRRLPKWVLAVGVEVSRV